RRLRWRLHRSGCRSDLLTPADAFTRLAARGLGLASEAATTGRESHPAPKVRRVYQPAFRLAPTASVGRPSERSEPMHRGRDGWPERGVCVEQQVVGGSVRRIRIATMVDANHRTDGRDRVLVPAQAHGPHDRATQQRSLTNLGDRNSDAQDIRLDLVPRVVARGPAGDAQLV